MPASPSRRLIGGQGLRECPRPSRLAKWGVREDLPRFLRLPERRFQSPLSCCRGSRVELFSHPRLCWQGAAPQFSQTCPLYPDCSLSRSTDDVRFGQKRTFRYVRPMSALPPKADIVQHDRDVRLCQSRHYYAVQQIYSGMRQQLYVGCRVSAHNRHRVSAKMVSP